MPFYLIFVNILLQHHSVLVSNKLCYLYFINVWYAAISHINYHYLEFKYIIYFDVVTRLLVHVC